MNRTLSKIQVARTIGISDSTVDLAVARGWLTSPTMRRKYRVRAVWRWSDLIAFVQTRYCWLLVAPERVADPALRAYAITARGKLHRYRWHSSKELQAHYCLSHTGLYLWRKKGWPAQGGEWAFYGSHYWLWTDVLPPPADPRPSPGRVRASEQFAERRRRVVEAVHATGSPPASGAGNGWTQAQWVELATSLGMHWRTCREHWMHARRRSETTIEPGVCIQCGKPLRTTRVCQECARGCSVPGCTGRHEARGLCRMHYMRWLVAQRAKKGQPCAAD